MGEPGKAAVLVIERHPVLRLTAMDLVEEAGFEALEAHGIEDALRILGERNDVRIVFSDIDIASDGDGLRLAHAIRDRWPPIGLIITSGRQRVAPEHLPARGIFFEKPYRREQVSATMQRLVA